MKIRLLLIFFFFSIRKSFAFEKLVIHLIFAIVLFSFLAKLYWDSFVRYVFAKGFFTDFKHAPSFANVAKICKTLVNIGVYKVTG